MTTSIGPIRAEMNPNIYVRIAHVHIPETRGYKVKISALEDHLEAVENTPITH